MRERGDTFETRIPCANRYNKKKEIKKHITNEKVEMKAR
jgi:hypothetical protein